MRAAAPVGIVLLYLALCLWLVPPRPEEGWVDLFDGRTLAGWVTRGGRYDGNARWSVEDGEIVGREGEGHQGGLLYTERIWRDVEVETDVWITYPFDSGIFLRMAPDAKGAQVTLDHRPGGEIAGVYADGWWLHNPRVGRGFDSAAWHRVRVRSAGEPMHLVAWLDGRKVLDYRFPEAAGGFAREGRIGLQVHGGGADAGEVRFRRIRARPLPEDAGRYFDPVPGTDGRLRVTAAGRQVGWTPLLGEDDLGAFRPAGAPTGYRVRGGVLDLLAEGASPHLATREDYRDFHLKLDFRLAPLANSGVFLRAARDGGNPAFSGAEVQILDDAHWEAATGTSLKSWQLTGSLYGAVPPGDREALGAVGAWNRLEVLWRGSRVLTTLNGRVLYDVDTDEVDADPPFPRRAASGFIGLQRHAPAAPGGGEVLVSFRNVFVRRLP